MGDNCSLEDMRLLFSESITVVVSTKLEENSTFLVKRVEHYRILKYEYNTQKAFVCNGRFSHRKRVLETEGAFTRTRFQTDGAVTTFRNRIKNAVSAKHTKTILIYVNFLRCYVIAAACFVTRDPETIIP